MIPNHTAGKKAQVPDGLLRIARGKHAIELHNRIKL
jgi:hypothetical protein